MNEHKYNDHSHHEEPKSIDEKYRIPYWKRAHHDWRFWTVLLLMLVAMVFYVVTDNFGSLSRSQSGEPGSKTPAE